MSVHEFFPRSGISLPFGIESTSLTFRGVVHEMKITRQEPWRVPCERHWLRKNLNETWNCCIVPNVTFSSYVINAVSKLIELMQEYDLEAD